MLVERRAEHHRVEIGAVAGEEYERHSQTQPPQLLDRDRVDLDLVGAADPAPELLPRVDGQAAVTGDHLLEVGRRLGRDLGLGGRRGES